MVFSGTTFLFLFLPVSLGIHLLLPRGGKWRSLWSVAVSLLFYAWAEVKSLPLIGACAVWVYGAGRIIEAQQKRGKKGRLALLAGMMLPAGALIWCKYAGWLANSVNALLGTGLPVIKSFLPLGLSFYTFSMVAYLVDVYRGKGVIRDFLRWLESVFFFGKMTAGPIANYPLLKLAQMPGQGPVQFGEGIWRFCIGLGKKAILSTSLAGLMSDFAASTERSALYCWLYAAAVVGSIYFDFSGYSDMALGIGRMFGYALPENFDHPLAAASVSDFWRRWHKSLGAWFRDYIYIPLGGSRRGTGRLILSTMAVWLFTGLWHGADWGYALWGIFFGTLVLAEKGPWGKLLKKLPKVLGHIYVALTVLVGFVVFGGLGLEKSLQVIGGMFGGGSAGVEGIYALRSYGGLLTVSLIAALPIGKRIGAWMRGRKGWQAVYALWRPIWAAAMLVLAAAWIVDGSFSPFFYAQY